ncbi:MAG TPA: hypothetical protein VIL52_02395 [Bacteroidota bacterium]
MTPQYRILITKTLEVPKNVLTAVFDSQDEAVKAAEEKLAELDGDVAIVMELLAGNSRVIQTFEKVRKAG